MKSIQRLFALVMVSLSLAGLTSLLPLGAGVALADTAKNEVCNGIGFAGGGVCGDNGTAASNAIDVAVNILAIIVGVAAVVMIIIAGLRFITASGDANKIAAARNSIVYALIGLVVVVAARTIVHYVIGKLQ